MKAIRLYLFLILYFITSNLAAAHFNTGLGVIMGEPTGISFKKWFRDTAALDAAVAWSLGKGYFHVHCDYLTHIEKAIDVKELKGEAPLYYGFGFRLRLKSDADKDKKNHTRFGVRVPVGITYIFAEYPLDIFLEVAPIFDLMPETDFTFNAGIGVRYYFK